jgi:hypothetical protein
MERVHGVHRASKVLVAVQEPVVEALVPVVVPVVEEILRMLDLS